MKKTCIINNYNYSKYIEKTIKSALSQRVEFDEIIIVDDGSTDNSVKIIEKYDSFDNVTVILKENGGQLSAFNAGFLKSTGDIIAFLDSDDFYEDNFLEETLNIFEKYEDVDHVFCDRKIVDKEGMFVKVRERYKYKYNIHFGKTAVKTLSLFSWTGNATSMNIFRRRILDKILPLDMEYMFRGSADKPLIMGVSLVNGNKFYLKKNLVNYRVHGDNMGVKRFDNRYHLYKKTLDNEKLFDHIMMKNKLKPEYYNRLIFYEYISKPTKNLKETMIYLYMLWLGNYTFLDRLIISLRILKAFVFQTKTDIKL